MEVAPHIGVLLVAILWVEGSLDTMTSSALGVEVVSVGLGMATALGLRSGGQAPVLGAMAALNSRAAAGTLATGITSLGKRSLLAFIARRSIVVSLG